MSRIRATSRIVAATVVLAAGLLAVGWIDYRATRRDLLILLIEQAANLRQAVSAAARSAEAAAAQAQSTLAARMLDNARLLGRLDRLGGLTQPQLEMIARQHRLFRVTVFSPTGQRERSAGSGGPPPGAGRGLGLGPGGSGERGSGFGNALAEQLLHGTEPEAVSGVHDSRGGRGSRLSAGVRRANGGVIVLNVDASDIANLQRQASIEHLLDDIVSGASEVAYVILVNGSTSSSHGRLSGPAGAVPDPLTGEQESLALARDRANLSAFELEVGGTPVLEFGGPVDPSREGGPSLRLGLSLEGVRSAERRSLTRLVLSLLAALGLGVLALALVVLRQEHGVLREEHARAQEALRRRDRLTAMGELASTVAHEVRNPLNAIGMSVQRLRREFLDAAPDPSGESLEERRELLEVLASETRRIDGIVQQFLEFARPPRLATRRVGIEALLSDVASTAHAMAAVRGVSIDANGTGAGEATVDPDQLKQALDNLVRNAVDASPPGARVTLRGERAGGTTTIVVEDRGPGIPPDLLPRVFDLYFTTKPDGTGIGLAVTHQIVEAHGGTIEVDTAQGRGTRMVVNLPVSDEPDTHA